MSSKSATCGISCQHSIVAARAELASAIHHFRPEASGVYPEGTGIAERAEGHAESCPVTVWVTGGSPTVRVAEVLLRPGTRDYQPQHHCSLGHPAHAEVRWLRMPRGPVSRGEALLNCYLDVFITFTVLRTPKEIGAKPSYLVNPRTGNSGELELDVEFEGFRLAFEFQGHPSHYADPNTRVKDAFKLAELPVHSRILIPVNVSQLNSGALQSIIANSMKDHVGVHDVLVTGDPLSFAPGTASPQQLLRFSKAVQRLYLAKSTFRDALDWIDAKARAYLAEPMHIGTVSATTPAPRHAHSSHDLDLSSIYANLRCLAKIYQP